MKRLWSSLAITAFVSCLNATAAAASPWVSGFYVGWAADAYPPSAVDYSSLSHVMVFSVLPRTNGTLDTTLFIDAVNGPMIAKEVAQRAHAAGKQAILVVGGAGTEPQFKGATSATYMNTFVANIIGTVNAWGFDGVDIDWEDLPATDYSRVLSLISNLRSAKPAMTITTDAGWLNANVPPTNADALFYAQLGNAVDQMNMMTYDMAGNWGGWVSWHASALYGAGDDHPSSVQSSANFYLNAGVPAAKLGIGIGFYGACWNAPTNAPRQTLGLSDVVASDNTMTFAAIKAQYYSATASRYDTVAEAPYLSFGVPTGPSQCTFVSYEDERSVAAKAQYVAQNGLGGTIIWQLAEGYDSAAADPNRLLHAVGEAFLGSGTPPLPAAANTLTVKAGTPQTTTTSSAFAAPLQALVSNSSGAPVAGVVVTFSTPATAATATFGGAATYRAVTDANGIASASATASAASGSYSVTASGDGINGSISFALTNKAPAPAPPASVTSVSGNNQTARVRTQYAQTLVVRVADASGQPIKGVTVKFTTPTGQPSASFPGGAHSVQVVTDGSGNAVSPVLTANNQVGSFSPTVTVKGVSTPTRFTLTNLSRP